MIAVLTPEQLASLRPNLDAINAQLARRGNAGIRVPAEKRPPTAYAPDALGWTIPTAFYPQTTGAVVVVLERSAWDRLNPASRALFVELATAGYPPGFENGDAKA